MEWIATAFTWYFYLLIIGIIFFPLTKKIFSPFFDKGYPFAKTLGIIFLSYIVFVLGILKLLPFTRETILFISIISAFTLWYFTLKKNHKSYILNLKSNLLTFIFEELLFIVSFLFLTFIRGQEPSIHGLEKFMDFGFINSILKSKYFPALDIWLSGHNINYYYFGHLTGAVLIKLTNIKASIGYNLILATIFAQGMTLVFSIVGNLIYLFQKLILKVKSINYLPIFFYGLIGAFIVNLAGNLHTIYLFTSGYKPENPLPFWQILSGYNPTQYWYPNATRFIAYTIHEFPSYSYVVADLHGHVFDIPFVLVTLTVFLILFVKSKSLTTRYSLLATIFLGFMSAIHYMTNAFDGPIYLLLTIIIFSFIYRFSFQWLINVVILLFSFFVFSLPFSHFFEPFVSGIALNCSPDFLVNIGKIGPFLFEQAKCQISPFWMMFILWGFFWICFGLFFFVRFKQWNNSRIKQYIFILFSFSTFLVIIPEFFYIKDIYPQHFRANTMFKLGYQAFIMMGIGSSFTFYLIGFANRWQKIIGKLIFLFFFFFVFIYPFFSFPSYYGKLDRPVELDGLKWMETSYPEDKEIIEYINKNINGQPVILEAQGDSYTDYERISANTGIPTVAGWWVHEWLWRGSPNIVGDKIPEIVNLYESKDLKLTRELINKYNIRYVVISKMEKQKYEKLDEKKFKILGKLIFRSSNRLGALYQLK